MSSYIEYYIYKEVTKMNQDNIDNSKKRDQISDDLYDLYNKLGKYELWLNSCQCRELTSRSVSEDRKIISRMMKQYQEVI